MIKLYDTTLRDGQQRTGVALTIEDKLRIAARLDALGISYIEGGFLSSNPTDGAFFDHAAKAAFSNAQICAFGMTVHAGTQPQNDGQLQALANCPAPIITLVGKAAGNHVTEVLGVSTDDNLRMIAGSVNYLVAHGKRVIFDAEHYFDGYKADPGYALATLIVAEQAGAECVVLCDTNGGSLPHEVYEITKTSIDTLHGGGYNLEFGIHAHNDSGCAIANSLEAVRAGVTHVQGSVNGFGERVGNADLLAVLANLQLKMGHDIVSAQQMATITDIAHFISETFNVAPDAHLPYVGKSAFAHKGGLHGSATLRSPQAYAHIDPALVGNFAHIVVSELAGKAVLAAKASQLGVAIPTDEHSLQVLLDSVKAQESLGYSYEVADASLALLLRAKMGEPTSCFYLESFRVIAEKREDGAVLSEATIKVLVGNERYIATGEGKGPVNALDTALRLAIQRFYPQVKTLELTDYKVRVLDESVGTQAVTRVLIETSDGTDSWGTVGVSENIIEASWNALVEAINYGLLKSKR